MSACSRSWFDLEYLSTEQYTQPWKPPRTWYKTGSVPRQLGIVFLKLIFLWWHQKNSPLKHLTRHWKVILSSYWSPTEPLPTWIMSSSRNSFFLKIAFFTSKISAGWFSIVSCSERGTWLIVWGLWRKTCHTHPLLTLGRTTGPLALDYYFLGTNPKCHRMFMHPCPWGTR